MITPVDATSPLTVSKSEVRRAIDEDVVVAVDLALEGFAQDLLATERGEQFALGRREIDVRGCDIDAGGLGREDHLGQ